MTEDVNQNENELFDDGGTGRNTETQQTKKTFNVKNYLNTRLGENEKERKIKIRIVLTEDIDGKKKFAIPVNIHSLKLTLNQNRQNMVAKGGYKSFICLNDQHVKEQFGKEGCPLCAKKNQIFAEANLAEDVNEKKAICKQAYSFDTKTSYIVRCIERGKESEGIKFWRFNKHDDGSGPFDIIKALWLAYNEAGINMFDYKKGVDLIITLSKAPKKNDSSTEKTAIKIIADVAPKPLGTDEEIDMWVNDPKDWKDMYRAKSFEYLSLIADDKTPVFDQDNKKWVPWKETNDKEQAEIEAAKELKEQAQQKPSTNVAVNDDEELPY